MLLPKLRVEKAHEPFDPLAATDCAPPPLAPAEIVTVIPPAPVAPDRVMLLPPANTSWLETVPLVLEVLPPEMPIDTAGAPMLIVLPAAATLTIPVPIIDDVAGTEAITDPPLLLNVTPLLLAKFRVWNVDDPPLAENAGLL